VRTGGGYPDRAEAAARRGRLLSVLAAEDRRWTSAPFLCHALSASDGAVNRDVKALGDLIEGAEVKHGRADGGTVRGFRAFSLRVYRLTAKGRRAAAKVPPWDRVNLNRRRG
jgi:biotin operon repressor